VRQQNSPQPRVHLFLEDFEVTVDIGIHDFEVGAPQRILINIDIEVDQSLGGPDHIDHVLDYDFIREEIFSLIRSRRYNLQETLCEDILAFLFARPEVLSAIVSTKKPDVYPDCGAVGCRMAAAR